MIEPIVFLVIAVVLLRVFAWRAVLCLKPDSARVELETPADVTRIPGELEDTWAELKTLGFVLLGAHSEKYPLKDEVLFIDGVHEKEPVVASLTVGPDEQDHLTLWTQSERGWVVTANFKRPSREVPGAYLSGFIDGAGAERLFKVHVRRVPEVGAPRRLDTLEKRVDAARAWFGGSGKPELRQEHAVGLLWSVGALGMVAAALFRLIA
ncbi:MAG: hypothetical protein DI536_01830 [Archangium gephyra]|uniref:Uncharacterized protein n=1 Tax=Archangium gephyra TaxID=48 RepID=A0A2W5VSP0_9BACT|nr:MAG: hypothetical protein DI536_01830 [Archangium gephyra]